MRIDLPCCSFKNCKFCFDGNCTNKTEFERCEFEKLIEVIGYDYDIDRLKVIVNQCMTMRKEVSQRFELTAKIPLDRLKELVEAERDGRCVVLPVKPGTFVWSTVFCQLGDDGKEYPTFPWEFSVSMMDEWGEGWHLTKEEAEAALKGE